MGTLQHSHGLSRVVRKGDLQAQTGWKKQAFVVTPELTWRPMCCQLRLHEHSKGSCMVHPQSKSHRIVNRTTDERASNVAASTALSYERASEPRVWGDVKKR